MNKRKRSDETTDDGEESELTELEEDEESERDIADDEEEFSGPKPKANAKRKGKAPAKTSTKVKGPPPPKKPRTTKQSAKVKLPPAPKAKRGSGKGKGKKGAVNGVDGAGFDAEQVAKDTKISSDNALFSASFRFYSSFSKLIVPCRERCYYEPFCCLTVNCRRLSGIFAYNSGRKSSGTHQLHLTCMRVQR